MIRLRGGFIDKLEPGPGFSPGATKDDPGEAMIEKGNDMIARSGKTSTAILAVLSLMQPLPARAQVPPGADEAGALTASGGRSFMEICAEAMIADAPACELHVLALQSDAEDRARAAEDAARLAAAEAEAAASAAAEAGPDEKDAAEARAAEMADAAAAAAAAARTAADHAGRIAAEAEAAAQAAAEAEAADAQAEADAEEVEAEAAAPAETEAQTIEAPAEVDAEEEAPAEADAEAGAAGQTTADADAEAQGAPDAGEVATDETLEDTPDMLTAEDCLAGIVTSDGGTACVQELTSESIAALGAEADADADHEAEVITETITESTHRDSSEEFDGQARQDTDDVDEQGTPDSTAPAVETRDRGLSELERAGLVALGAVVVGAILSNGQRVAANTGDRVVVVDNDGLYQVLKDDDVLLRQPGTQVRSERFNDGSIRSTVTRGDGTRIVTILDSSGRVLRRTRIDADGREYLLIDDTRPFEPVIVQNLPRPGYDDFDYRAATDRESLRRALLAADRNDIGRRFSLRQIREISEVRALAPEINIEAITFATNSAALQPSQAEQLRWLGLVMRDIIASDPTELFLIEGHTDAVGDAGYNLLLSDRRAETVALALNEYFGVPTENMVVQGYGESYLRVATQNAERQNRRVSVRRITGLVH